MDSVAEGIETKVPVYDSNPFTLCFRGFGLFTTYAKNVLIVIVIIGMLGFVMNLFSTIPNFQKEEKSSYGYSSSSNSKKAIDSKPANMSLINGTDLGNGNDSKVKEDPAPSPVLVLVIIIPVIIIALFLFILFGTLFSTIYYGVLAAAATSVVRRK